MRWSRTNCIQKEMLQPAYFIFEQHGILCISRVRPEPVIRTEFKKLDWIICRPTDTLFFSLFFAPISMPQNPSG